MNSKSNNSLSNGGFPPLKIIKEKKKDITLRKERHFKPIIKELNIKNILSQSIVKPMIDLNKPKTQFKNDVQPINENKNLYNIYKWFYSKKRFRNRQNF